MPRNEDGEFELILGNRQLLSVFFIVVILLGVFFTMGYIVGRNSSPLSADASKDRPVVVDPGTRPNPASEPLPAPAQTPVAAEPVPTAASIPLPVPETRTEAAKPEPAKPALARAVEKPQPASPVPDQPTAGQTYLQITAVAKAEAQLFVDVLAKKGFHAIYVSVPDKPQVYRVLVGPIRDVNAIQQTKADLEKAGFQGLKALMRKF
jgi:cell division septation protein DedD